MPDLEKEYDEIIDECLKLFENKLVDYGPTWLFFRDASLIDQLWIKAKRIAVLEENNDEAMINEGREGEYIGIINYSVIMLMKILYSEHFPKYKELLAEPDIVDKIKTEDIVSVYKEIAQKIKDLMLKKNHDYGDAWRGMQQTSITDQIIIKLSRIKKIMKNSGILLVSENIDAQLFDIVNYSVFGLIKLRQDS